MSTAFKLIAISNPINVSIVIPYQARILQQQHQRHKLLQQFNYQPRFPMSHLIVSDKRKKDLPGKNFGLF